MKKFAQVSIILSYILEVFCFTCVIIGFVFKSQHLEGGDLLLILGFFLFAGVYFLVAIIPYHKRMISGNPVFQQTSVLVLRRLLYFILACLSFAVLFQVLELEGKEFLGLVVLVTTFILILIAIVLILLQKERRLILQWVFIRLAIFLILYLFQASVSE